MRARAFAVLFVVAGLAGCGGSSEELAEESSDVRACDGKPVNVLTNPNHCGRCGQACGPREECRDGTCQSGGQTAAAICARGETRCGSLCCPGGTQCGTSTAGAPACVPVRQNVKACGAGEDSCQSVGAVGCCPAGQNCSTAGTGLAFCSVAADFTSGSPVCEPGANACQGWCCVESACVSLPLAGGQNICG